MNAIFNETHLSFCDQRKKTNSFSSRLRHINSKSHNHKEEYGTVVKKHEFSRPESDVYTQVLKLFRYSMLLLKIVQIKIFILLIIVVYMILNS